jgi:hypothetical protein
MADNQLLNALIPTTQQVIKPWITYIPNGGYYVFQATRPCYLEPLDSASVGTCYWYPETQPASDTVADQGPVPYLSSVGHHYVKHSAGSSQGFRVVDAGGSGNAIAVASAIGILTSNINLQQVGGTTQSGVNVSARYSPVTWGTPAVLSYAASSTAVLAANTSRRGLMAYNSDAVESVALTTESPATAFMGFMILGPKAGYIWNPLDAVTTSAIKSWATGTGTNKLIVCEGT